MKYEITVVESWSKRFKVSAESEEEAKEKALAKYRDETGNSEVEGIAYDLEANKTGVSVEKVRVIK